MSISIKSYVCRNASLSSTKQALFDKLWPIYRFFTEDHDNSIPNEGISNSNFSFSSDLMDSIRAKMLESSISVRPKVLEIGFGRGDSLFQMCQAFPEQDFIGIEIYRPGLVNLLVKLEKDPLPNLKLCLGDAVEILKKFPQTFLDRVHIFFPDPWPKQRHHKRRLIQPEFVSRLAELIKPNGILHLATDWEDYAKHMLRVLSSNTYFVNHVGDQQFAIRPEARPMTKYEKRGQRLGHNTWDILFRRVPDPI